MWSGEKHNKVWIHFRTDILATGWQEGDYLAQYIRTSAISKSYLTSLEVIDLQRYKIITRKVKVKVALNERIHTPFVFAVGKN